MSWPLRSFITRQHIIHHKLVADTRRMVRSRIHIDPRSGCASGPKLSVCPDDASDAFESAPKLIIIIVVVVMEAAAAAAE